MSLVYVYDGTLEGLLCCVYESFFRREIPSDIQSEGGQLLLSEKSRFIRTNMAQMQKVYDSLKKKIGRESQDFVQRAFLTNLPNKEILIFRFILSGYKMGGRIFDCITKEPVFSLVKAVRGLEREVHNYIGFIRFSLHKEVLFSRITPKNQVLPLLSHHFSDRYPEETFLIWDRTHKMALVHRPGYPCVFTELTNLFLLEMEEDQRYYETLWQCFQKTIAIEERKNPLCQMSHLPKRYWSEMTEFIGDVFGDSRISGNRLLE